MKYAILAIALALTGCATLGKAITPTAQIVIQAAADAAVATAVSKGIPASQIKAIASQALALSQGNAALADIEAIVNARIGALKLPPGDMAAVQLLTSVIEQTIQTKIASNTASGVNSATQVAIADVLGAVVTATSYYPT